MAADISIRWVLSVIGEPGKKILAEDRAIRSSLTKTDAQYQRTAATAASASARQASSLGRVASSTEKVGRVTVGTSDEVKRFGVSQLEAIRISAEVIAQQDKQAAAYKRTAAAAKQAAAEEAKRVRSLRTAAHESARGGGVGATVAGAGLSVARSAVLAGAGVVGGGAALLTLGGLHKADEVAHAAIALSGLAGLAPKQATALAVITQALGINTKSLGQSFGTLGKQVIAYEKGSKSATEAFKAFGLSKEDVTKLRDNLPALIDTIFQASKKLPQAERAGFLKQVLGRGGTTIPLIEATGPIAQQTRAVSRALGNVSPAELLRIHETEVKLKEVTAALELSFAQTFGPPLIKLLQLIIPAVKPVGDAIKTAITTPIAFLKKEGPGAIHSFLKGLKGEEPKPGKPALGAPLAQPLTSTLTAAEQPRLVQPVGPRPLGFKEPVRSVEPFAARATAIRPERELSTLEKVGSAARDVGKIAIKAGKELLQAFKPAEPFFAGVLLPVLRFSYIALSKLVGPAVMVGWKLLVVAIKLVSLQLGAVATVVKAVAPLTSAVGSFVGKVAGGFASIVGKVASFVGRVGGAFGSLVGKVAGVLGKVIGTVNTLPGRLLSIGIHAAGSLAQGIGSVAGKVGDIAQAVFSAFWGLGRKIVSAIVSGLKSAPNAILDAVKSIIPGPIKSAVGKVLGIFGGSQGGHVTRRGFRRYGDGGMVDAMLSPGEKVLYGGGAWTVPGARTAADSVYAPLPVGAAVLTGDGQRMVRSGASVDEAITYQRPHFQKGGFVATAYGPPWGGIEGSGTTATGINLSKSPHVYLVAVDPSVIPLHSRLRIKPNPFGNYAGNFAAEDTGGAIKGNRIDFYDWRGRSSQNAWGRRNVSVTRGGKGGALPGAVGAAKPLTQDIRLGPSRTRAGLIPDALMQGVEAGGPGLTPEEINRAAQGGRGARTNPIIAAIVEGLGPVTRQVSVSAAAKAKTKKAQKAGGPTKLALGGTEKSGTFAGVRIGVANMARETIKANPGLSVTSTTHDTHASGSLHYQGRAVDVAGANSTMLQGANWLKGHYGNVLTEGIHNPNLSVKYGKDVPSSYWGSEWARHANHIHMALRRGGIVGYRTGGMSVEEQEANDFFGPFPRKPAKSKPWHGRHTLLWWGKHLRHKPQLARTGGIIGFASGGAVGKYGQSYYHGRFGNSYRGWYLWNKYGQGANRARNQSWGDVDRSLASYYHVRTGDEGALARLGVDRYTWHDKWASGARFRLGGVVGRAFRLGGQVGGAIKGLENTAGNKVSFEGAVANLESLLSETTTKALERLRQQFTALARKGGSTKIVHTFQAVITLTENLIGNRIKLFNDQIGELGTQAERHQGRLDRSLRKQGIDPASAAGLTQQIGEDADTTSIRRQQVERAKRALTIAKRTGNVTLIASQAEKLGAAEDELDEAVTKAAEDQRALIAAQELAYREAAQQVTDNAAFSLSSAQNELAKVEVGQRLSRTAETPGGERAKASAIETKVLPALQNNLAALNNQLGVLQTHGGTTAEIQQVLTSIQTAGNEIGTALADAAELIRQAAEQAAQEAVEGAQFRTSTASLGEQKLELEQRLAGTFTQGGQQRADYVNQQIIPALQAELAALATQKQTAEEQGDAKLARQIAEAIGGEQNKILEAQLTAMEDVKANTAEKKLGGTLGFQFGGEGLNDQLVSIGSGA